VNAQIDKISKLQADGMKARFDATMQARAVLTPEQLKKLRAGPGAMRAPHSKQGED
jgi:Spy/CpxP family protein refolding chaperone